MFQILTSRLAVTLLAALFAVFPTATAAQTWQGAWNSTQGQLRLIENGSHVYGDVANLGTIEGVLSPDKQVMRAIFTRNDGGRGFVEFVQAGDHGNRITGRWTPSIPPLPAWDGSVGLVWRGDRTDPGAPPLTQFRGPSSRARFLARAPSAFRSWSTFRDRQAGTPPPISGAIPPPSTNSGHAAAPRAPANPLARYIPALADLPGDFRPRYVDVRIDRISVRQADAGPALRVFGLAGLYAYCETAAGARALVPFGGRPNRVVDVPRANAPISIRPNTGDGVRRFAFDEACLTRNGRISVQIQSNLKERDLVRAVDDDWGYRSVSFYLDQLPDRRTGALVATGNTALSIFRDRLPAAFSEITTLRPQNDREWVFVAQLQQAAFASRIYIVGTVALVP